MLYDVAARLPGAVKFIMPDFEFGLDIPASELEPVHLPFPSIAIEVPKRKHIVIASQQDSMVFVQSVRLSGTSPDGRPLWAAGTTYKIKRARFNGTDTKPIYFEGSAQVLVESNEERRAVEIHYAEQQVATVLALCGALSCANVSTERINSKPGAKVKAGHLPFDSYHILMVQPYTPDGNSPGGSHRPPREHLRRGHWRQLSAERRVWINNTTVNAGVGFLVTKDYAIQGKKI